MGPGVLLSTGYIAGGAIGGVLVAFLTFSDEIPQQLSAWQYRQTAIVEAKPLQQQYEDAAALELGIKTPEARDRHKQEIEDLADEIREINEARLPPYIRVPQRHGAHASATRKHTRRRRTPRSARLPAKSRAPRGVPRCCRP